MNESVGKLLWQCNILKRVPENCGVAMPVPLIFGIFFANCVGPISPIKNAFGQISKAFWLLNIGSIVLLIPSWPNTNSNSPFYSPTWESTGRFSTDIACFCASLSSTQANMLWVRLSFANRLAVYCCVTERAEFTTRLDPCCWISLSNTSTTWGSNWMPEQR